MATRTEDYPLSPARPSRSRTQALVVAFPASRALPIPASKEVFGRDHLRALGIVDKQASSKHVAFTRPGGVLHIEDIGSRNGTWIDGVRLPPRSAVELRDGAVLRIGSTLLVVREDFQGPLEPSPDIGELVGPFGLRGAGAALDGAALARPASVLIEGETGTGKELVARAVARALRGDSKYTAVNVAGVAASVFEAQMFGHVPTAFTDAGKGSPGILAAHAGGTVFLDEIGELAPALQAKLLRVLDQREVLAVGAPAPRHVDVTIVAATNRPLAAMVESGAFRRDLHARLAEWPIELPALRDRAEDVSAIAAALRARSHRPLDPARVDIEAVERLLLHPWPANVRELASVLARAAVKDPPGALTKDTVDALLPASGAPPRQVLTEEAVRSALAQHRSEVKAAASLGVSRPKLRRFLGKA
jgi:MoxR-like ATPase